MKPVSWHGPGGFQGEAEWTTCLEVASSAAFRRGYADRLQGLPPRDGYIQDVSAAYERGRALANSLIANGTKLPKPSAARTLSWQLARALEDGDVL